MQQIIDTKQGRRQLQEHQEIALISGAHGFIGGHLVTALNERNIKPLAIPRELLYKGTLLKDFVEKHQPDYIYHLAAYGNHSFQTSPSEAILTNIGATYALLEATEKVPYKAFVNVSTSSIHLSRQTFYSATKYSGELLCQAFAQEHNKPIITVRPYSVYGEGEADFRFIPKVFVSCIKGEPIPLSPKSVHDWIYVQDFVRAMIYYASVAHEFTGEAMDIGTGTQTSNERIVQIIEELTEKKAAITERRELRSFDTTNWRSGQGIYEYVAIEDGLQRVYEYIKPRLKKKNH